MFRTATLLAILSTNGLPCLAFAERSACLTTELVQSSAVIQRDTTKSLLSEIDDHRYEDCSSGSECQAHISKLAEAMNQADSVMIGECPTYQKWQSGITGLIDPRDQANGTLHQYADDGHRHALYEQIVGKALSAASPDQENLQAVMTMGAPGSGKSYVLNHLGLCKAGVVIVDPDEYKSHLAEYLGAVAADDLLAADRVHRESSMLSKRVRDEAIATRRNICIDGVLAKKQSAIDLISRLHAAGYEISLVAISVPFDVAYDRVLARGDETGRFVPYEYAKQAHANIEAHSDALLRMVDHGFIFDTNNPNGEPPRLIIEYAQGEKLHE